MPANPVPDDVCLRAYRAYIEGGGYAQGARLLKYNSIMTFKRQCRMAEARGLHLSGGARAALETTGLNAAEANLGWRRIQNDDGSFDSVMWKKPESETVETPEDLAERIAEAMNRVKKAPAIKRPKVVRSDILNFIPVFDFHLSMRIGDYGTAEAVDRLKTGTMEILERLPSAERVILVNGGDFTEANDPSNQTPKSKHPLSVDAEYDDTTDIAVELTVYQIESALKKSDHVTYKALRGNHDPTTARILRAALAQRYHQEKRVTIDMNGIDFFAHAWGGNFIAAHHGDLRKKPSDFVLGFATKFPQEWAKGKFRELWTGHNHAWKFHAGDEVGMAFNQVRPICPSGRYATENMWDSPSEMIGVSYRNGGGRQNTVTHNFF